MIDSGNDLTITRTIKAPRAVVWTAWTIPEHLEDEGGATKYTAQVMHKDEEDRRNHEQMGFHDGWGTCIDQLDVVAAGLAG